MQLFAAAAKVLNRCVRWESSFLHTFGIILTVISAMLLFPTAAALFFGDDPFVFAVPMLTCLIPSVPLFLLFGNERSTRAVDGLLLTFVAWGAVMLIGSVPYVLSGMTFPDGIFESVSGFTTTGQTVLPMTETGVWEIKSLILWRSMTQWAGGIAIILMFVSLLPLFGTGGRSVFENEMSGSGSKNLTVRARDAAMQFTVMYAMFSAIFFIASIAMGIDAFESVCLTFTVISTGGFMPHSAGFYSGADIGYYPEYFQMLFIAFMFIGGVNYYLHYQRIYRKRDAGYLKNSEFKAMVLIFAVASAAIFALTFGIGDTNALVHAKDTVFTVVSYGTTAGYSVSADITDPVNGWVAVPAAIGMLMLLTVIGGSAGSTSGGMKVGRALAVLKDLSADLKKRIYPRAVFDVKTGGETLDGRTIRAAYTLFFLFMATIAAGVLLIMMLQPELALDDSLFTSLSAVTNTGAAGPYGPVGGFDTLSDGTKILLSVMMWVGRLEVGTALLIFMPYFWREVIHGRRKLRRADDGSD